MTRFFWREAVRLGLVGVVVASAIPFCSSHTQAQVVADPTLGSVVTDTGNGVDTITGGATRETNLFHSFDSFSVLNGRTAFFDNATNIQNILTRVTGGSISNIDGLIRANGAANLFLLNPNGIIFGRNARLNIGGSFIATTASNINFADGTQFSATPGTGTPLLTVSVPIGLQFGTSPGEIVNRASGAGLQVGSGRSLGLVGGNVSLDGGNLTASGGRVELGAVAAPGVVEISPDNSGFRFSFPTDLALGDMSLTNRAVVDTRAGGGGSIAVNTRNLSLTGGSQIGAGIYRYQGSAGAAAGDVDINAQGTVVIDGVGQSSEGFFSSGILNYVEIGSTGKAGNLNIKTGSLSLTNGGRILTDTLGTGDAGNITIDVSDTLSINGVRRVETANGVRSYISGIYSTVGRLPEGLQVDRKGGDINIKAGSLSLDQGGRIDASTFGVGDAGNILLQVNGALALANDSKIFSSVVYGAEGNGGTIDIKAETLSLTGGSEILASLESATRNIPFGGRGNGGKVIIDVRGAFSASGSSSNNRSGVFTTVGTTVEDTTVGTRTEGKGGDIEIKAGSLSLDQWATIDASTFGLGDAGNILLQVNGALSLANNSTIFSSVVAGAVGNSGTIDIKTGTLSLTSGGRVLTPVERSFNGGDGGRGNGGKIIIDVRDTFSASGSGSNSNSSGVITTVQDGGIGNGGDIEIKAGTLSLSNGGRLNSSSTGQGNAGNIDVNVRTLNLDRSSIFATTNSGDGGNIRLRVSESLRLRNSSRISATAGLAQLAGNGGNITIDSPLIIANIEGNNDITANAFSGSGGRVDITADSIFGLTPLSRPELQSLLGTDDPTQLDPSRLPSNDITAISQTNPSLSGTVSFNAADIEPSRDLVELPTQLVDASTLVASGCPSGAENRFAVTGRGGLPPAPGDKLSSDALLTDWASLPATEIGNSAAVPTIPVVTKTIATPLVEATSWQFDRDGNTILTAAPRSRDRGYAAPATSCHGS